VLKKLIFPLVFQEFATRKSQGGGTNILKSRAL